MKVLIVGGVAGGASAAARLRRLDERAEIIIFERSGYVSYANCGLPYYIGGVIEEREDLTLQTPESFRARFNIDVRVRQEVLSIDRLKKEISVCDLQTGRVYRESYDKLILSPGARPVVPDWKGTENGNVYTLRTVEDALRIREAAVREGVRSAVVIGGGFIGLETAENLRKAGLCVYLIQRSSHVLPPLDDDMASFLHAHIRGKGVDLRLRTDVEGFEKKGDGVRVLLRGNPPLDADMVVLSVGVVPESSLAERAGLSLGEKGSIAVDAQMRTSDADIFAVGDAVSVPRLPTGERSVVALAGPANKQGRIAADNIAGAGRAYGGSSASSVLKVFDMTAAFFGLNERAAKAAGKAYDKVILSPASHASYYPGGRVMTVKVLFERETERILGAQIVGFDGVDKRLDILSVAMQAGLKISALAALDLAYAPPYASAKDPVNMVGFVAQNVLEGKVKQCFFEDLPALAADGKFTFLDTRTREEYAAGHADGFGCNIPLDELRSRLGELDKSRPVCVMCHSGLRSYLACRILSQNGFDCYNFAGGYRLYESIRKDRFDADLATDCGMPRGKKGRSS